MKNLVIFSLLFLMILLWNCKSQGGQSRLNRSQNPDSTKVVLLNLDSINFAIAKSDGLKVMRDAGVPGTVAIKIYVDSTGKYLFDQVIESPHPIATQAVTYFIPFMRFKIEKGFNHQADSTYSIMFVYRYTTP